MKMVMMLLPVRRHTNLEQFTIILEISQTNKSTKISMETPHRKYNNTAATQTSWNADLSWTICLLFTDHENVSGGITAARENGVKASPTPAAYSGIYVKITHTVIIDEQP